MKKRQTIQLTTDAMLAAMCAVLGYFALDLFNFKLSFESLPVLVAALLFGPLDGALVGLIGTFLYQFLRYGLEASTPLWVIPYGIIGLVCGLYARKYKYYNTRKQIRFIVAAMEILIFLLNTVSLYLYAELFPSVVGKSGLVFVLSGIVQRSIVAVAKAVAFALLMPSLLGALHRFRNRLP
ncbi:MAG: ECF transporter S component [Lachnospiraceae bacterium]|nr:ECF transporter S component [Lachnospiraceae bacterium]